MIRSWISAPSVMLISLPYLFNNWQSLFASPFFSVGAVFKLLVILVVLESLGRLFYHKNGLNGKRLLILLVVLAILFFYAYTMVLYLQGLGANWRSRILVAVVLVFFSTSTLLFFWRKPDFRIINVFFFIFGLVSLGSNLQVAASQSHTNEAPPKIVNNPTACRLDSKSPVLLLIADEYSSPDEWMKVYGDSSVYTFSNLLQSRKWQVSNSFHSHETSTFHSLSSLFNFNLSGQAGFSQLSIPFLGANKLLKSALSDSLRVRGVEIINYGIVALGNTTPLTRLYFYPTNFWEQLLFATGVFHLFHNTNGFDLHGFGSKYYLSDVHNKQIIQTLSDSISKSVNPNRFIYAHLYMPHRPLVYQEEFDLRTDNSIENQFAFWQFTNSKLNELLLELNTENHLRIILVGDHGYRGNAIIASQNTFAAFYGFEAECLEKTMSVQDIGHLILAAFQQESPNKISN